MRFCPSPPFVLLEDRGPANDGGWLFSKARNIVRCDRLDEVPASLARVENALKQGLTAAGFIAYECYRAFEPRAGIVGRPLRTPLLWFGLFEQAQHIGADFLNGFFASQAPAVLEALEFRTTLAEHREKVEAVRRYIAAGDVYQVNLTFPIDFKFRGDPLALYAALRAAQPVAHGGVIATGDETVISVSPELFVSSRDGIVTTRPMKGTAARGDDLASDYQARLRLLEDPKERAENLMIVDLLRNDLSRICLPGTVRTPALFSVETYPSFHALTSTITGELRPGVDLQALLTALYPCGSIVGAPKIRASQVIAELEQNPRGAYTGAIGVVHPDGDLDFSVAIRTATLGQDGRGRYGVGGGIVADSSPEAEYEEACLKARVLTDLAKDFELLETLRWSAVSGFSHLDAHLRRLGWSAQQLEFGFDEVELRARVLQVSRKWTGERDRCVRIALHRSGRVYVSDDLLRRQRERNLRLGVFDQRLDAGDPMLRHKTTRRPIHDAATSSARLAGLDEMVLLNRAGSVADGARSTLFVARDGVLVTPTLQQGALPGILREDLLAQGRAREAELTIRDFQEGEIFIGSSLRGLRPARMERSDRSGA